MELFDFRGNLGGIVYRRDFCGKAIQLAGGKSV
jgi:hypothetical protein